MVAEEQVVRLRKPTRACGGTAAGSRGGTILPILSSSEHTVSQVRPETAASRLEILKVSATSNPGAVAGAIEGVVRTQHTVKVQAIGAVARQSSDQGDRHLTRICGAGWYRSRLHPFLHQHIDQW